MLSSRLLTSSCLLLVLAGTSCDSKVTSALDPDLQAKVELVTDCIPPHFRRLDAVVDFSNLWRQGDNTNNPPDPTGLEWNYNGTGIDYCMDIGGVFQIAGVIQFYAPTGGAPETGFTLSTVSLSQAIDDAATELRNRHASGRPFMVGEWTIYEGATCNTNGTVSGGTSFSTGATTNPCAFTGMIAGSANQNELEELAATEGVAAVGSPTPPVQDCNISTNVSGEVCVFTFGFSQIFTDEEPGQEYPRGVITWSLTNQATSQTVSGTLTFNKTNIAVLDVTDVGVFDINVDTLDVTAR
ncbi:MAG: hypothetical protein NXI31_04460 [bacterium]|nr:hypothetical protein [bacterium]